MAHYRNCRACGNRFLAQRVTRSYCSDSCRLKWHRSVWNDPTSGTLSLLLRQVADAIDAGRAQRAQVTRLRVMLAKYDQQLSGLDTLRFVERELRKRKSASS